MIIGFTGTRKGCAPAQLTALRTIVAASGKAVTWLHGGAAGADAELDFMLASLGISTVVYPSERAPWTMFVDRTNLVVRPPASSLDRNREIVRRSHRLVACPDGPTERGRGGTWYTVRRARHARRPITIVFPDGTVKEEAPCQAATGSLPF